MRDSENDTTSVCVCVCVCACMCVLIGIGCMGDEYLKRYIHTSINIYKFTHAHTHIHGYGYTGWRRCIGWLNLHVIFRKRATNSRALLRKMTCKDKASYGSSPPCISCAMWLSELFSSYGKRKLSGSFVDKYICIYYICTYIDTYIYICISIQRGIQRLAARVSHFLLATYYYTLQHIATHFYVAGLTCFSLQVNQKTNISFFFIRIM